MKRAILLTLLAASCAGCMVDGLLARVGEEDSPEVPPPPEPSVIRGRITLEGMEGAQAQLHAPPASETLVGNAATVAGNGEFSFTLPGSESFTNLVVSVHKGQKVVLGVVPPLARLESVFEPGREIGPEELTEFSGSLDRLTTARLLVLIEAAWLGDAPGFSSIHPEMLSLTLKQMGSAEGRTPGLVKWEPEFVDLFEAAGTAGTGPPLIDPLTLRFNPEFAAEDQRDSLLQKLRSAAAELDVASCFDPESVRVVFNVEMKDGMKDGDCKPINRWLWAKDEPGKKMFLAIGVHETMEGLDAQTAAHINQKILSDWEPNQLSMYDDATHGDLVAGDGIWSVSFDLPRLDPPLRLGYKYTWGSEGANWTDTEEWPGNHRLLELVDNNEDGLILRYDRFADESSNKNEANMHPAALFGMDWDTDLDEDGLPESQEAPPDLDGDCVRDRYPEVGVGPLLGDPGEPDGCSR